MDSVRGVREVDVNLCASLFKSLPLVMLFISQQDFEEKYVGLEIFGSREFSSLFNYIVYVLMW